MLPPAPPAPPTAPALPARPPLPDRLGRRWGRVFEHDVAHDGDRPTWLRVCRRAVDPFHCELFAEQAHLELLLGDLDGDRLGAGRRDRFDAAGAGATSDAVDQVRGRTELALH